MTLQQVRLPELDRTVAAVVLPLVSRLPGASSVTTARVVTVISDADLGRPLLGDVGICCILDLNTNVINRG